MKFLVGENGRKPREKPTQTPFRPPRNQLEGPRRELGTPAVGGERLTACATTPPTLILIFNELFKFKTSDE